MNHSAVALETLEARLLMAAQPDLVITALKPVLPTTAGQTIWYEYTIKNQGSATASLKDVALQTFVSKDGTYKNADDLASGGFLINASSGATLGAGKSISGSAGASVAFDPFVHKYLTAMIDSNRKLAESNENNNTKATAFPTPYRDQFEDDNSSSAAKSVPTNGTAQNRSIHKAGDVDWAKFTLTAKSNVVIETNGVKGGDNELWLYGPNSSTKQVTYDNNTGTDSYAKITRTLDPGTYYLKTQEYGNNATLSSYTLKVTATLIVTGDQYEVDDTAVQAKPLSMTGQHQQHSFHRSGDVDWVKFSLSQKSAVNFYYVGDLSGNGVSTTLFGPNSSTKQMASATLNGSEVTQEGFLARILSPGTYYLRLADRGGNDSGTYSLAGYATPLDAFEPDQSAGVARAIGTNNAPQSHTLHNTDDMDWMKFTLTSTSNVSITLTEKTVAGVGGSTPFFTLFGPNSSTNEIHVSLNDGDFLGQVLGPGTYYIKAEQYYTYGDETAAYDIRVSAAPADLGDAFEVDNTAAQAKAIPTDGTVQVRSIHAAGDTDWAKFTLTARSEVVIETNGDSGGDNEMWLYGPNSATTLVEYDDDDSYGNYAMINRVLDPGTYYLKLQEFDNNGVIDDYTIQMTATAVGDAFEVDNAAAQAKTIATNGTVQNRSFHTVGDVDWAKFTLTSRSNVVIETDGVSGGDNEMWLYGPNSSTTQVEYDDDDGNGNYAKISRTLDPGTYYIKLQEFGNNGTIDDYTLRVVATTVDAPADWNFEGGWNGWTTDAGVWEVGNLPSSVTWPVRSTNTTSMAGTDLDANYPSNTDSRLISPATTLDTVSGAQRLELRFREAYSYSHRDSGTVQVSVWDGSAWGGWQTLATPAPAQSWSDWSNVNLDVTAYAGRRVRFAFLHTAEDYSGVSGTDTSNGWFLDNVRVWRGTPQFGPDAGFENGWGSWTTDAGVWQVRTASQFSWPSQVPQGSRVIASFSDWDGKYPSNTDSRLISAPIDISAGADGASLVFDQAYSFSHRDRGEVQVSVWNGAAWDGWQTLQVTAPSSSWSDWSQVGVSLNAYTGRRVRIAFAQYAEDYSGVSGTDVSNGWFLDNLRLQVA